MAEVLAAERGFPRTDWRATSIALAAGLVAFVLGNLVEARVVALARRGPLEFEWVSDVVLTGAVVVTTWLWLHLKASRTRLLELERRQVAFDTQMRLAAEIQRNLLPDVPASAEETGGLPYATCIIARIESRPGRLAWANAGHPAGALRNAGAWTGLASGGPPLGLLPGARYEQGSAELTAGTLGVLVTDGITEALEGVPLSVMEAMTVPEGLAAAARSPARVCDYLIDLAARSPGPPGAPGWQDDRTVFAFGAEA
jgi:hypothetical protein